jgi:hypothetical protein
MRILWSVLCVVMWIGSTPAKAETVLTVDSFQMNLTDETAEFRLKLQSDELHWTPSGDGKSKAHLTLITFCLDNSRKVISGQKESLTITANSDDPSKLSSVSSLLTARVKTSFAIESVRFLIQSPEGKNLGAYEVERKTFDAASQIPRIDRAANSAPADSLKGASEFAGSPVDLERLEKMLTANRQDDNKLAKQLYELELTERLSATRLARYEAGLPGPTSRRALAALAGRSLFLDPPTSEILTMDAPSLEDQRKMIALCVDYVRNTLHQLPNLYATKVTTSFQRTQTTPPHWVGTSSTLVRYVDGKEILGSDKFEKALPGMTTAGEFGPILLTAVLDAAQGGVTWAHWEQGTEGPVAVFRYAASAGISHYNVNGHLPAYHGEIAIDPANGTIYRLKLQQDADAKSTIPEAEFVLEYGQVSLSGKTYICPLKGVAVTVQSELWSLNDIRFEQYHLYRATAKMLPVH